MKKNIQNLLPKKILNRVALISKFSKIKLGFPKKVVWLAIISVFCFLFSGYYPTFGFPPVKRAVVYAQISQQQGEVIPASFSKPLILPHPGYLSTKFFTYHPGIDIATGLGMPIHPVTDGDVVEAGFDIWGLGNFVVISHEKGYKSKYAHMGKIFVKVGQKVTSENILGEVGLTGHTSGPHTHLEITRDGKFIDPLTLLPELPPMPLSTFAKK